MRHPVVPPKISKSLTPDLLYTTCTTLGNRVYARARDAKGRAVFVENPYAPTYYLPSDEYTGITSHDGLPLRPRKCASIFAGREFLERTPDAYGNIQPEYQYLADVYGTTDIVPDMDQLYIVNFDIEVDAGDAFASPDDPFNAVTVIGLKWRHRGESGVVAYGYKDFTPAPHVTYVRCDDEADLLTRFIADWSAGGEYPDIVTGWNVQFYDVPYLINRVRRVLSPEAALKFSPFERIADRRVTLNGRDQNVIDIRGVAVLDMFELYRKFTYSQQESYRLDHIAHVELKQRKMSYDEYQSLPQLYQQNFQKFVEYCIQDVELVDDLETKLKFIELVCALAYAAKANYVDTFKQVRLWDVMIYHYLRGKNRHIPPRRESEKTEQYAGAYVKDPLVGLHPWVCSFDVASMYPHIIRQWNLSPETLVGDRWTDLTVETLLAQSVDIAGRLGPDDLAVAANGVRTSRDVEGFLPEMLKVLYDERVRFKEMANQAKRDREKVPKDSDRYAQLTKDIAAFNNQQLVRKVNLNSAYGACGSQYFRFYNTDMAEAVTLTGQMVIRWVANDVNAFLNRAFKTTTEDYVIASDTDSIYVRMGALVDRYRVGNPAATDDDCATMLDQFCRAKIEPILDRAFNAIAVYLNVAVPCLSMKREVIAAKGLWTAKKRYVLNCLDIEGVRFVEPKLKVMGLETVKSSTPALCRTMLNDALKLFLRGTQEELWQFVEKGYETFRASPFEDVAFPRSVNGMKKYADADKSVPIAVRGALVYNTFIQSHPQYEAIRDGAKIKFAYLRAPNRFQSNVMSAPGGCPPEWKIETILDYQTQWSKSFIDPLESILQCAGWSTEKRNTLF